MGGRSGIKGIYWSFPLKPQDSEILSVEETSSSVHQEIPGRSDQARCIWGKANKAQ